MYNYNRFVWARPKPISSLISLSPLRKWQCRNINAYTHIYIFIFVYLYVCIYIYRNHPNSGLYSHYMTYSQDVPFFRSENDSLLTKPFTVSVLTAPCINLGCLKQERHNTALPQYQQVLRERISRILTVALLHKQRHLILGAYGCGVFRNDPNIVAREFALALSTKFEGLFESITFAIPASINSENFTAFKTCFSL